MLIEPQEQHGRHAVAAGRGAIDEFFLADDERLVVVGGEEESAAVRIGEMRRE